MALDIPIAAKRYDGQSGTAVFTGVVPFAPGVLPEEALSRIAVINPAAPISVNLRSPVPTTHKPLPSTLVTPTTPTGAKLPRAISSEIGATVVDLHPRHPDGTVKAVQIHVTLDLPNETEIPLICRYGDPRLVQGPPKETINQAWMKWPKLIGCTDAAYMCAARLAFGPLVPVNDPRLPQKYKNWLTTEMEGGHLGGQGASAFGYPGYKYPLELLHAHGQLGARTGILTPGSPVITQIRGGAWPHPDDPETTGMLPNDLIKALNGSAVGSAIPIPDGTRILSVDGPDQITLNAPVGALAFTPDQINPGPPRRFEFRHGFSLPSLANSASYNVIAPLYYRYMTATSGHLDKLREAHLLASARGGDEFHWNGANGDSNGGSINFGTSDGFNFFAARYNSTFTDSDGVVHPALETYPTDEYGSSWAGNPIGNFETTSGFHQSAYMCYALSGWQQPLGVLVSFGMLTNLLQSSTFQAFPGDPNYTTALSTGITQGGWRAFNPAQSGARSHWRWFRETEAFLYMLSLPMDLRGASQGGGKMAPSPRVPANKTKWKNYFKKKYYDVADLEAADGGWGTGAGMAGFPGPWPNAFLSGKWGWSPYYQNWQEYDDPSGTCPLFQLITVFNALVTSYMNIIEDPRVLTRLGELAVWVATQQQNSGPQFAPQPLTDPQAPPGTMVYPIPYNATDPARLAVEPLGSRITGTLTVGSPVITNLQVPQNPLWVGQAVQAGFVGATRVIPVDAKIQSVVGPLTAPTQITMDRNAAVGGNRVLIFARYWGWNVWSTGILMAFLVWAWRVTGNAKLLQMADAHATIYSFTLDPSNPGATTPYSFKSIGECYGMAHYAAAWRAGETWGVVPEGLT